MKYLPSSKKKLNAFRAENRSDYCPISNAILSNPALDHCHKSGLVRGYVDKDINAYLGRVENAYVRLPFRVKDNCDLPTALRRMADYIENPPIKGVLHPVGVRDLVKRFKRAKVEDQLAILEGLRQIGKINRAEDFVSLKNSTERAKLYEATLKKDSL